MQKKSHTNLPLHCPSNSNQHASLENRRRPDPNALGVSRDPKRNMVCAITTRSTQEHVIAFAPAEMATTKSQWSHVNSAVMD